MRHPIEKCNEDQAKVLAALPEEQREWMARMFRIGNATCRYYQRASDLTVLKMESDVIPGGSVATLNELVEWLRQQINPQTESRSARELLNVYFDEYLAGLPHEGLRRKMQEEGVDKATRSVPFRRYLLERHDIGMDEFLRQNLSEEDYAFHLEAGKPLNENE